MTSRCKQCGEQLLKTSNYTYRILPAKRIPKKAKKLMKRSCSLGEDKPISSSWSTTKFQKFLLKRSRPENFIELTCGKCGGVSKVKMEKRWSEKYESDSSGMEEKIKNEASCNDISLIERPRKKAKKDKSAGLTLPDPLSTEKRNISGLDSYAKSPPAKKMKPASSAQRQKELEKLNKMLFSSKKAKKSGSSLQDFLSSI